MAHTLPRISPCRSILILVGITTIFLTFSPIRPDAAETAETAKAACDYMIFIDQNPLPRADFITMRNRMYDLMLKQADPDVRYRTQDSFSISQPKRQIDEMSQGCLGCHDELGAVKKYGSKSPSGFSNIGMSKIAEAHPVGLVYEKRTLFRDNLKSSAEFPLDVVLVNGRISCITCHDPLNSKGNHMAGGNRSALCFVCHNM